MTPAPSRAHLTDFVLLELLDGRGAAEERAEWLAHAQSCAECGRTLYELRRTAALVSSAVARIQLPSEFRLEPPEGLDGDGPATVVPLRSDAGDARRVAVPSWWRAAAVLALLLVPLVAVQPLRAAVTGWLADRWAQVSGLFVEEEAPATIAGDGATIYFEAAGPDLEIRFDAPQPAGTLSLSAATGERVSFEITADAADEAPVVSGSGLRIRNGAGSVASYAVGIPPTVRRVQVRVGDGPASHFQVGGADWRRVVPVR